MGLKSRSVNLTLAVVILVAHLVHLRVCPHLLATRREVHHLPQDASLVHRADLRLSPPPVLQRDPNLSLVEDRPATLLLRGATSCFRDERAILICAHFLISGT